MTAEDRRQASSKSSKLLQFLLKILKLPPMLLYIKEQECLSGPWLLNEAGNRPRPLSATLIGIGASPCFQCFSHIMFQLALQILCSSPSHAGRDISNHKTGGTA